MAELVRTKTLAATNTAFTDIPPPRGGYVRIENLEATGGIYVWLNLNDGVAASVEGNNCVRIPPAGSYVINSMKSYNLIAASGTPKVLFDANV